MSTKICSKCNLEKSEFSLCYNKDKTKSWEKSFCRDCEKLHAKLYRLKNKEKIKAYGKKYKKDNPELIKKLKSKHYRKYREKFLLQAKTYAEENSLKIKEYYRKYSLENKEKISEKNKKYRAKNKELIKNKENLKYKNNFSYKMRKIIGARVRESIFKNKKSLTKHLPYSLDELKQHIEKQFEPWMSWNNYGRYNAKTWVDNDQSTWTWQVDHIIPLSKFTYHSIEDEEFKKCWALSNLRPLSSKQNLLDSNKR